MIPEQYWRLVKRWFWLILPLGIVGALVGFYLIPVGLGESSGYNARVTLGVGRFVSFGGIVTASMEPEEGGTLAEYTASIADMATTQQFEARLKKAAKAQGLDTREANLADNVAVEPNGSLYRITVTARAETAEAAEILADEAANLLMEQALAEEGRVIQNLAGNTEPQKLEILARLSTLSEKQHAKLDSLGASDLALALDDLLSRSRSGEDVIEDFRVVMRSLADITGDSDLALLNSETEALEGELVDVTERERTVSLDLLRWSQPAFVLNPVETVATEPERSLRKRDMVLLGSGAGLLMGWIAANVAEGMRNRRESSVKLERDGDQRKEGGGWRWPGLH